MAGGAQTAFVVLAGLLAFFYSGKSPIVIRKVTALLHGKAGCAPVGEVGNVTLHYFAGRGRAEVLRLMMEEAGIPYTQLSFNKNSWPAHKEKGVASGLYTFGQVPAIETSSGVRLVQSQAIAHYLGRATGMECDCEDLHLCEVIALATEDIRVKLGRMLYDPNYTLIDRKEYLEKTLPVWLAAFEKLAPPLPAQDQAFFASERLTWVDFLVFDLLDINIEFGNFNFGPDVKPADVLASFPKLNSFYQHFRQRPHISQYLASKRRLPYKLPNFPKDVLVQTA